MSGENVEADLRAVLAAVDRIPEAALQAANAAIGWRDLDAELALLTPESGVDLAHLRGGQPRLLTFRSPHTIIELEVSSVGGIARLLGQLDPARAADVIVESATNSRTARADSHGRFGIADLDDGWLRVVVTRPNDEAERTATEWFRA